ncbi:MAG TPA: DNA gyrase C-terminal beta-propeller domain-containing protein, partial [Longimicrobiaceae bacterium]|nr:DNA gyrase C-terminal beta-propeller domain-containing protein [Longimicrobiaceae bacterium]
ITLALDGGIPHEFTLKELLERFRDHRIEVVVRRSRWELERAREEAHVLEGLLIALANIDRVVKIIRSSRTRVTAGEKLRKEFDLSERQAEAILQMRLYRLTQLEGKELRDRLDALAKRIKALEAVLKSPRRQLAEVRKELESLAESYGDKRRTRIVDATKGQTVESLIAHEDVVVTVTREGYIKQTPMSLYRRRVNAGKTLAGMERYDTDFLEHVFVASTADTLMFFSDDGQAYWLPVDEIAEAGRSSRGRSLHQILNVNPATHFVALLSSGRQPKDAILVFFTRGGTVKRTPFDQFGNPRAGGVNAINLRNGDTLLDVQMSGGNGDLVMVSRAGRAIRFPEREVSPMGRAAQGVRGIKLAKGDRVVGAVVARRESAICLVSEKGFAARVPLSEFSAQKRDGLGVVAMQVDKASGSVVAAPEVVADDELMLVISSGETHRLIVGEVPVVARGGAGEVAQKVKRGEMVVEVTRTAPQRGGSGGMEEDDEEEPGTGEDGESGAGAGAGTDDSDGGGGSQFELLGADG